jgi:hypothetical protein
MLTALFVLDQRLPRGRHERFDVCQRSRDPSCVPSIPQGAPRPPMRHPSVATVTARAGTYLILPSPRPPGADRSDYPSRYR